MLPARSATAGTELDALSRRNRLDDAVVLEFVFPGAWRDCDARVARSGAGRFLAFVEELDGRFEVMQLADEFMWSSFATMRSALTHVVDTHPTVLAARPTGDPGWIR
jgi:hypothetical protein